MTSQGWLLLWLSVPLWAPALRAVLPWRPLPRAGWFTLTVAGLVYGAFSAWIMLVMTPIGTLATFIGPQLQEMDLPAGRWLIALQDGFVVPVYAAFIPALPSVTWVVMLLLARHWAAVCAAFRRPDAPTGQGTAKH
ncbi:hypothetical protein KQ945_04430 [Bacillus subtilis subsp. subtilis]|nr:hypothetical protein [Bacillus subtilis subsp. subtilis]